MLSVMGSEVGWLLGFVCLFFFSLLCGIIFSLNLKIVALYMCCFAKKAGVYDFLHFLLFHFVFFPL